MKSKLAVRSKMSKVFICLATSFAITLLLVGFTSRAYAATSGDYEYSVNTGLATITGYHGSGGSVTIPKSIDGYVVVGIGNSSFANCTRITSISFPSTLQTIRSFAFEGCTGLKEITLPVNLTEIYSNAFKNTTSLTTVRLNSANLTKQGLGSVFFNAGIGGSGITLVCGSTCKSIPDFFMYETSQLKKVILSSSVTTIGCNAFDNCINLSVVTLGTGLKEIDHSAFRDCESLKTITLPRKVSKFGVDAFYGLAQGSKIYASTKTQYETLAKNSRYLDASSTNVVYRPTHLSEAAVASISAKTYNGKAFKPSVTVKMAGKTLKANTDYTLTYKNNKKTGKATVTIKGKGNYTGSISKTFNIKPAKVTGVKATSSKKGKVTVKWSNSKGKAANVTGYKIVVKSGSKTIKTQYVSGKSSKSKTITLANKYKGKKVKVYVYAYKTIDKTKVCSAVSSTSTVKVKK